MCLYNHKLSAVCAIFSESGMMVMETTMSHWNWEKWKPVKDTQISFSLASSWIWHDPTLQDPVLNDLLNTWRTEMSICGDTIHVGPLGTDGVSPTLPTGINKCIFGVWLTEIEKLVKVMRFEFFFMEARTQAKVFWGVMLSNLVKNAKVLRNLVLASFFRLWWR